MSKPLFLWPLLLILTTLAWADDSKKRPTDEQRGKELYERHCLSCHGPLAKGDGPATSALVVPIPDLAGQVKADKPTLDLVEFGRGAMPAFEATFDTEDARRVLKYMSAPEAPKPPAAPAAPAPLVPPAAAPADAPEGGEVTTPE
jgi:mono/diheme cytochrome c family protein